MKAVQPSYLHLSNILSGRVEFSGRVIESSFSTRPECSGSTSQFDPTLFQKNSNSTRHFSSRVPDSNSSTRLDVISLLCCKSRVISFDLCCDWLKRSDVLKCWFWLLNIIQLSFDDSFHIYVFIHSSYCLLKVREVFKDSVSLVFSIFWLILQVILYQWFKSFEDIFFEVWECKQYLVMRWT